MRSHRILLAALALAVLAPVAASAQDPFRVFTATNVSRGVLGFYSEPVPNPALHQRVVIEVIPESPAAKAGLEEGDTLLRINGLAASPQVMSAPFEPGDTVTLRIRRGGAERDLTVIAGERTSAFRYALPDSLDRRFAVTMERVRARVDSTRALPSIQLRQFDSDSGTVIVLGADTVHIRQVLPRGIPRLHPDSMPAVYRFEGRPPMFSDSANFRVYTRGDARPFTFDVDSTFVRGIDIMAGNAVFGMRAVAGAELAPLNPELAEYFGATDGVLVLNAAERTPAERAGLRGGDVIVRVGDTPVRTIRDVRRAIDAADGDVTLRVLRHGRNVDVTITR